MQNCYKTAVSIMTSKQRRSSRLNKRALQEDEDSKQLEPPSKKRKLDSDDKENINPNTNSNSNSKKKGKKTKSKKKVKSKGKGKSTKWSPEELYRLVKAAHEGQYFTSGVIQGIQSNIDDIARNADLGRDKNSIKKKFSVKSVWFISLESHG